MAMEATEVMGMKTTKETLVPATEGAPIVREVRGVFRACRVHCRAVAQPTARHTAVPSTPPFVCACAQFDTVTVHATGTITSSGEKFWSTKDEGQKPFVYQV